MINEEKLSRAINNVLDNKVKYNPVGSRIGVKTEVRDNYFYIILSDNGECIPQNTEKIYLTHLLELINQETQKLEEQDLDYLSQRKY